MARNPATDRLAGDGVVSGSVLLLPQQTRRCLNLLLNLPVPGQPMAPNDLIREWSAAAMLELNNMGHATAASVCFLA